MSACGPVDNWIASSPPRRSQTKLVWLKDSFPEEPYLSDGVGRLSQSDGGRLGAIGGVCGDDVGGVDNGSVGVGRDCDCGSSKDGQGGELHLDGW